MSGFARRGVAANDFGSPRAAFWGGAREAFGAPAVVLGASYLGFGSFAYERDMGLGFAVASTLTAWALPGQIALMQLYSVGASLTAMFLAVAMTNLRLLPMTVALLPILHVRGRRAWRIYLSSALVAVTAWAVSMLRCPAMPAEQRMPYFAGFGLLLWTASLVGTVAGFALAFVVPPAVALGLAFLNPVYFMLMFVADLRHRGRALALLAGVAGALTIDNALWGLMTVGLVGGSAAFAADLLLPKRWWPGRA